MFNPLSQNELIDTHCHLNDRSFDDDRDEIVKRAVEAGVKAIVDIGVNVETSKKAVEDAKKYEVVYASVGIDAEVFVPGNEIFDGELFAKDQVEIGKWIAEQIAELEKLIDENVVMIGECGMDYHWLNENKETSEDDKEKSKILQKQLFASQVELSIKHKLPLSIHSRGAESECIEVIRSFEKLAPVGSFHSFTGTSEQAREIIKLGFKIGVNGIVTYQKADNVREVVRTIGTKNVVYETDSPYLTPSVAKTARKGRNEPSLLPDIKEYVNSLF